MYCSIITDYISITSYVNGLNCYFICISSLETAETTEQPDPIELIKPSSNDDYINMIRKRLNEDASARAEREKRRRKVLVDQIKAHEAQEVFLFAQTLGFFCCVTSSKVIKELYLKYSH